MTANLLLQNVFRHGTLSLDIRPGVPFLVTGKNESGKTSIALSIAALAAHEANPAKLTAGNLKRYVKDGEEEGFAKLTLTEGDTELATTWRPPSTALQVPPGVLPWASPESVGMVNFIGAQAAEGTHKLRVFEALFLPTSVEATLKPFWPEDLLHQLDSVIETIERDGWDGAKKIYTAKRRDAKAEWKGITGVDWGSDKGTRWVPPLWDPALEGKSKEDLEAECVNARDYLTSLTVDQAVSQAEIDKAREAVATLPALREKREGLLADHARIKKDHDAEAEALALTKEAVGKLKQAILNAERQIGSNEPPVTCPACQAGLTVEGSLAKLFQARTPEQMGAIRQQMEADKGSLDEAEKKVAVIESRLSDLSTRLGHITQDGGSVRQQITDAEAMRELSEKTPVESTSTRAMSAAETAKKQAEDNLLAWERWKNARTKHDAAVMMDQIVKLLGPNGARQQLIEKGIIRLQQVFDVAGKAAGWNKLTISPTGAISSGGRPVRLTGESSCLKAQWLCQFAWAFLQKERFLVFDRGDTLRDESWDGLVGMVTKIAEKYPTFHIIVCSTSTPVPDGWDSHVTS